MIDLYVVFLFFYAVNELGSLKTGQRERAHIQLNLTSFRNIKKAVGAIIDAYTNDNALINRRNRAETYLYNIMASESIVVLPEGKVKLVSGDGFEFIIDEEAARVSSTIRGMLDSQGKKNVICCLTHE